MHVDSFIKQLRAGDIKSVYLLEGDEEFTKEMAWSMLKDRLVSGPMAVMNFTTLVNPTADELIAAAETLPFMADKRLILVKEAPHFTAGRGGDTEEPAGKNQDADRLKDYLPKVPESSCLVFFQRGKAAKTRALVKALDKLDAVVTCDKLPQDRLVKWVMRQCQDKGRRLPAQLAEEIVLAVGQDMNQLWQELQKLIAYTEGASDITAADIEAVVIKSADYQVFDLSEQVALGRADKALVLMQRMLAGGEARLMLLSLLQRHFRQLYLVSLMQQDRQSPDQMARVLQLPPFVIRKLLQQARNGSVTLWEQAYLAAIDTEFQVKSGQQAEDGCLENLVLRVLTQLAEGRSAS